MNHFLRAAAALTTAFSTLLAPLAAGAQTYQLRQRAPGLVVASYGVASLSSQSLTFSGATGDWAEHRVVSLTNTGQGPLGISRWAIPQGNGYNGFYFSDNTCPEELSPGQTCTVAVYAQIQSGARTASLELSMTNSSSRVLRLQLASSESTPPAEPSVTLSTNAVSFGSVPTNTTVTRQVVAANSGDGLLTWGAAPAVTGDSAFSPGLTSCGSTLAAGSSCQAEVSFTPTSTGSFNGMLTFTSTLANSPHQVSLEGTAFNPVSLAAATLPAAKLGMAYSYDFKSLLSVSNEVNPDKSQATWSSSGTLPTGLSLNTGTGVLAGTPTAKNSDASYTVTATYKGNQGQNVFTLTVGDAILEAVQISGGESHTCVVTPARGVKCWGKNNFGQIGDGTKVDRYTPVDVEGLTADVASVSAGYLHTCALTTTGVVKCWGYNESGQASGGARTTLVPRPEVVPGLGSIEAISAGAHHTCAVTTSGAAMCWGTAQWGALGYGGWEEKAYPVNVVGLESGVKSISAGGGHTCAVTSSGGAKCWGYGLHGQLGDGTKNVRHVPVDVIGLTSGVTSIAAGDNFTCATTSNGGAKCWGRNNYYQLGDGTMLERIIPVDVQGLADTAAAVDVGTTHGCVLTDTGGVKCWGINRFGEVGDGTQTARPTPVSVTGLTSGVTSFAAGVVHNCAILSTGKTQCWGGGGYGALGTGIRTFEVTPADVKP